MSDNGAGQTSNNIVRMVWPASEFALARITLVIETQNPAGTEELHLANRIGDTVDAYYDEMANSPPNDPVEPLRKT